MKEECHRMHLGLLEDLKDDDLRPETLQRAAGFVKERQEAFARLLTLASIDSAVAAMRTLRGEFGSEDRVSAERNGRYHFRPWECRVYRPHVESFVRDFGDDCNEPHLKEAARVMVGVEATYDASSIRFLRLLTAGLETSIVVLKGLRRDFWRVPENRTANGFRATK